jgi:hypothetical protein
VDDIVAIRVTDSKARKHYFLTWGRIFDSMDPTELESVVAKHASNFGIKNPRTVSVCDSLQNASTGRYFYEHLFHLSQERIPFGESTYWRWRAKMKRQILSGQQLFYCGAPVKKARAKSP